MPRGNRGSRRRWRLEHVVLPFAGYLVAVAWLTWPLALHLGTKLPTTTWACFCDQLYAAWVLAWESHALVTPGVHLANANIYAPTTGSLYYGSVTFGALPYFAPVYWATGNPTLALNVTFLLGVALTASMIHVVTHRWTGEHLAGVIAGLTFCFSRWILRDFVPSAPYFAIVQFIPVILAMAARPILEKRPSIVLAGLVALQASTDVAYVALAIFIPLGLLAVARSSRSTSRRSGFRLAGALLFAGLAVACLHVGYLATTRDNPNLIEQTYWTDEIISANPLSLPWGLFAETPLSVPFGVFGLVALGALLFAIRCRRSESRHNLGLWGHCLFWLVVGVGVSLPRIVLWRHQRFVLWHLAALQTWLPLLRRVRIPARMGITALVALALLSGLSFAEILRLIRTRLPSSARAWAAAVATLAIVVVLDVQYTKRLAEPRTMLGSLQLDLQHPTRYPLRDVPAVDPRTKLLLARSEGAVLELPLAGFDAGLNPVLHATAMYRSISFGWYPLVNGYSGNWPHGFTDRMALALRLPDRDALVELERITGLRYVIVRKEDPPGGPPSLFMVNRPEWLALAANGGRDDLRLEAQDDQLIVFRLAEPKVQR